MLSDFPLVITPEFHDLPPPQLQRHLHPSFRLSGNASHACGDWTPPYCFPQPPWGAPYCFEQVSG